MLLTYCLEPIGVNVLIADGLTNSLEVLSMNRTNVWKNRCNSVPNLPQKLHRGWYSKMAVLSSSILICGGAKTPRNACLMLRKSNKTWMDFDKMITGRYYHSMAIINEHPMVVGGITSSGCLHIAKCGSNSAELYEDGKFKNVTAAPVTSVNACLETLNDKEAILIGGDQNGVVSKRMCV